ncbi:hypothetical protein Bca52824_014651 [Brassica carinata]|uniref:Uncharacterized protein n=1 Tax=Brassica carinata TaxID=52824 RepID=A0A8X7W079_BRACI|nr:hypothetical protein Bca52824_014651 [Brassica carinata]
MANSAVLLSSLKSGRCYSTVEVRLLMVCNQFIHFLLINQDFSPPPINRSYFIYMAPRCSREITKLLRTEKVFSRESEEFRVSPASSSSVYGGKIQIFDCR